MSAHVAANLEVLPSRPFSGLASFRIIPRIETYPSLIRFAQTILGKFVLLAFFALGLRFSIEDWIPLSVRSQ